MSELWWAIAALTVGGYALKASGYFIPEWVLERPRVTRVALLTPVALLSALTAVQIFGDGQELVVDARAAGLLFAVGALLARAPFLVVVVGAALVAALLRLLAA